MQILLVEDDMRVTETLVEIIHHWGYEVESADTCKKTLTKLNNKRFDLILLDIFLPDGPGYELIPRIRDLWPAMRIVTMTGYHSRELEMEVRKQGVVYYMIKPFDTSCLKELLDHLSQKYDHKEERKGTGTSCHRLDFPVGKGHVIEKNFREKGGKKGIA